MMRHASAFCGSIASACCATAMASVPYICSWNVTLPSCASAVAFAMSACTLLGSIASTASALSMAAEKSLLLYALWAAYRSLVTALLGSEGTTNLATPYATRAITMSMASNQRYARKWDWDPCIDRLYDPSERRRGYDSMVCGESTFDRSVTPGRPCFAEIRHNTYRHRLFQCRSVESRTREAIDRLTLNNARPL